MKNAFTFLSPSERIVEDKLYEQVYEEISLGKMDKAAQARAIEEGGGDEGAVKKAYVKHRIFRLKAEKKIKIKNLQLEQAEAILREQEMKKAKIAEAELERQRVHKERVAAVHDEPLSPFFVLLLLFSLIVAFLLLALNHFL